MSLTHRKNYEKFFRLILIRWEKSCIIPDEKTKTIRFSFLKIPRNGFTGMTVQLFRFIRFILNRNFGNFQKLDIYCQ